MMRRFTFSLTDPVGAYRRFYSTAHHLLGERDDSAPLADPWLRRQLALHCRPQHAIAHEDLSLLGISELIARITTTHHPYLFAELGRLAVLVDWCGDQDLLVRLEDWASGLRAHMEHEERELFPLCRALDEDHDADPDNGLHGMYRGHEDAEAELNLMCDLVANLAGPTDVLAALRSCLTETIADLHQHIELEDGVLLPAVIFERDLRATRSFRKSRGLKALEPRGLAQS
jgi:iron-sulfur cluster repair protein YtfE (RIC family)